MAKLYACIISSDATKNSLVAVAQEFAYAIEVIGDGVLFDVSGLERLVGKPDRVSQKILGEMRKQRVTGSVAVAETVDTAMLLARCTSPTVREGETSNLSISPLLTRGIVQPDIFEQLPLTDLNIERDTLNVFSELGLRNISDLLAVPQDELVSRYGREFTDVIDVLEQRGKSLITPNIKENRVAWSFELDNPVEDFEQLIFLLNHGLERLFAEVKYAGFSTEHLDISLKLCSGEALAAYCQARTPRVSKGESDMLNVSPLLTRGLSQTRSSNAAVKNYEIKTSFPTLDREFWLKLINLRGALDPPEASIIGVDVIAHFTKPRPAQRGLYAVSRPEPESLLLTVGKLKKLVGEENVGAPVMLDQRLAEAFKLDPVAMPDVSSDVRKNAPDSLRLSRSICGEARLTDAPTLDLAAPPPLSHVTDGGIAAKPLSPATERQSLSANRAAEPLRAVQRPSGTIAFTYFRPPLRAEVLIRDARLVFIKTRLFAGHVINCSGVWKGNSKWWDQPWRTQEWDIEVENAGVYRLCKAKDEWFLLGEYD